MARSFALGLLAALGCSAPASANPIVCRTSLEAPPGATQPVEMTRCGPVTRTAALVEQRFFTYTSPFARGVDLTHQITDLFGIAMGGADGSTVMGLGFPDQTIVWDGSALQNTVEVLLEQQSQPMPWRTADVPNGFSGAAAAPIRGLW
jgi:hypothetical protein